jgi:5-methyltetrahydrofolate--homocysteine methyltransferase
MVEDKPSFIRRVLTGFYRCLHKVRWVVLVVCAVAIVLAAVFGSKIGLPTSSDVRLLDEGKSQFEANYQWRLKLLYDVMVKKSGSTAYIMWGTTPADTGDRTNPESWSQLVLDNSFEPSSEEAQVYLRDFCGRFFDNNEWAKRTELDYECPINRFDAWLRDQANSTSPDMIYVENCGDATELPVAPGQFHACVFEWSQQIGENNILARDGKVEIMYFPFSSRVRFDSPFGDLDREWKDIDSWLNAETAPGGVTNQYHTSEDFWWYDTNGSMLDTAYTAAAIAIGTGALVILFSSRSVVLTIFSTVTIGYVLASVTATLVAIGWTLGFLESICFAILIGISCDFVIHFAHSYSSLPGNVARSERTLYSLVEMGPSILAAGFTTISAATIMLFTVISFFQKFAVVLFLTVLQATAGSFIVFLVLTDCFGPAEPTALIDSVVAKCQGWFRKRDGKDEIAMADTGHGAQALKGESNLSSSE